MPIYAYRCEACGFAKDALQKISDAPLSDCPECGKSSFKKQLTAAGFQLKGSGWYVTDFRGGSNGARAPANVTSDAGGDSASSTSGNAAPSGTTATSGTTGTSGTPASSGDGKPAATAA